MTVLTGTYRVRADRPQVVCRYYTSAGAAYAEARRLVEQIPTSVPVEKRWTRVDRRDGDRWVLVERLTPRHVLTPSEVTDA